MVKRKFSIYFILIKKVTIINLVLHIPNQKEMFYGKKDNYYIVGNMNVYVIFNSGNRSPEILKNELLYDTFQMKTIVFEERQFKTNKK